MINTFFFEIIVPPASIVCIRLDVNNTGTVGRNAQRVSKAFRLLFDG